MKNAGFTLIELLVTVAIVAVLASAALPLAEMAVKRTKEQDLRRALREVREAIDAYRQAVEDGRIARTVDGTGYPARLEDLVEGVEDQRTPNRKRVYFLRRLPRDPFADTTLSASQTWGKRSYASPPENPAEGADVFDVYSRSSAIGMSGRPYRDW